MATARYVDPAGDWDWWGTMRWPPDLQEFDPGDWPEVSVPEAWRRFRDARRAGAPRGWRLARVQMVSRPEL